MHGNINLNIDLFSESTADFRNVILHLKKIRQWSKSKKTR